MLNLLTIDLEDYFQVHAFSRVIRYEDWDKFECRIERNTDRLLELLASVPSPQPLEFQNGSTAPLQHCNTSPQHSSTAAPENNSKFSTQNLESNNSVLSPQHLPKATFFILGWLAERYPDLVRRIQKEGHEIACHGYAHRLVYTQSRDEFRQDIKRAKSTLEDITGSEVVGYRAPSYSITDKSQWAFEVLAEEGFKYDSSIFPIRHDFYGMPNAPRFPFVVSLNGTDNVEFSVLNFELNSFSPSPLAPRHSLIEFPISTIKLFGQNVPISGGGYFRLFPYSLIRKGLRNINEKEGKPFIFYMHPWEIDPNQPRVNGVSSRSKFRHYVNLDKTEIKFKRLLNDFQFSTIRQLLIQASQFKTQK
jgi:polysaccharide deacetylase family protein (PEP-CTERM system associated)